MKIILSRKGFDSEYGGQPSPIMPDGALLSLPISSGWGDTQRFSNLKYGKKTYLEIIQELKPNTKIEANEKEITSREKEIERLEGLEKKAYDDYERIFSKYGRNDERTDIAYDNYSKAYDASLKSFRHDYCHLDPDIRRDSIDRQKGWLPMFGQASTAQSHLSKKEVKKGDLFLFFGWFKATEWKGNALRYKRDAPDQHIIWGYLQIGEIYNNIQYNPSNLPGWMQYHSHAQKFREVDKNNCIYVAPKNLTFAPAYAGAGCLTICQELVLTKKGHTRRTEWDLPNFFKNIDISYHSKESWKDDYFKSADKGQEFVIEADNKVMEWAQNKIIKGLSSSR